MRVYWTKTTEQNLDAIYAYIAQNSTGFAQRADDCLTRRSQQIAKFPFSGRIAPEFDEHRIRELIETPYRIIYYIKPSQIDILAVIHGSQDTASG